MFPRNPRNWELRNHLVPIKCIGGGSFGTVWEAYHSIDKGSYAIKTVGISATLKLQNYKICQEVRLLQSLDHTNIVKYHDSWVEGPNIENLLKKEEKFDQTGSLPDDYHGDSELRLHHTIYCTGWFKCLTTMGNFAKGKYHKSPLVRRSWDYDFYQLLSKIIFLKC